MRTPYSIGDVLDVRIEKIVPRGFGLAFADKLTVLVPLAAPGDTLRVQIRDLRKRLAFAEIIEVITPGEYRAVPPCPYFGSCGGCDFQQLSYDAQLAAKVGIIRDCLHRIGKIDYLAEIETVPSPPLGYRARARWHADNDTHALGYFRRDSHEVIDVEVCPILEAPLQDTLARVRRTLDWHSLKAGITEIEVGTGDGGKVSMHSFGQSTEPSAELSFVSNGEKYLYSARTFFQANKHLISALINAATGDCRGTTAFDLYCGVGLFSLPLARQFDQVIGVEGSPEAVAFAKKNAFIAGLKDLKISLNSVDAFLVSNKIRNVDLVVIDPPRSGTEKKTIPLLAALKPRQISYVSCEPSILARDLAHFLAAGYVIEKITALDLFPQTHHIETVARLRLT